LQRNIHITSKWMWSSSRTFQMGMIQLFTNFQPSLFWQLLKNASLLDPHMTILGLRLMPHLIALPRHVLVPTNLDASHIVYKLKPNDEDNDADDPNNEPHVG
ncbi:hypothetical protein ACJX0J_006507, partial [Zea mays]